MSLKRLLLLAAVTVLPLCAGAQQLTLSAAASLTDAFKELATRFEATHAGVTLRLNFAASGVLLQQIIQGAPVDVFVSADQATVLRGIEQKLFDADSKRDFASNTLVLVVPAQDGPPVKSLADLGSAAVKRIAVGKLATVPVGGYTKEALDSARLWSVLEPKFVYGDSVRQLLDYVARGEADAGFVYRTDATSAGDKVRLVLTLQGHTPVTYPAVVVSATRNQPLARDFVAFLSSATAHQVLARYGFGKP